MTQTASSDSPSSAPAPSLCESAQQLALPHCWVSDSVKPTPPPTGNQGRLALCGGPCADPAAPRPGGSLLSTAQIPVSYPLAVRPPAAGPAFLPGGSPAKALAMAFGLADTSPGAEGRQTLVSRLVIDLGVRAFHRAMLFRIELSEWQKKSFPADGLSVSKLTCDFTTPGESQSPSDYVRLCGA